jgi:hypothetical protein
MPAFASVLRVLCAVQTPYLVIGGHAVTFHGYPRNTFDLDLLVAETGLPVLRQALEQIGYREFFATDAFLQMEAPRQLPPIDLMIVDQGTFDLLEGTSQTRSLDGEPIKVPDALRLIALKLHAARDARRTTREIDWLDIAQILQANQINFENPEFQAILREHGGPQAPARIRSYLSGTA